MPRPTGQALIYNGTDWLPATISTIATSVPWSGLTAAGANLTLANGCYTTFDQTSAATWTWANTTATSSGTAQQDSPSLNLSGMF